MYEVARYKGTSWVNLSFWNLNTEISRKGAKCNKILGWKWRRGSTPGRPHDSWCSCLCVAPSPCAWAESVIASIQQNAAKVTGCVSLCIFGYMITLHKSVLPPLGGDFSLAGFEEAKTLRAQSWGQPPGNNQKETGSQPSHLQGTKFLQQAYEFGSRPFPTQISDETMEIMR